MLRGFDRPKLKFSRIRCWGGTTTRQESASCCPRYVGGVLRGYARPLSYCYLVDALPGVLKPFCVPPIWLGYSRMRYRHFKT
eukprot:scaffold1170_cov122-Cylindrotheca_fusiformis.AAC.19